MNELRTSEMVQVRRTDIEAYAKIVFGYLEGQVPIRLLREKGTASATPWSEFQAADASLAAALVRAAERAARDRRGLFVVPGTVREPTRARAEDIVETAVLVVDLDQGDVAAKLGHLEAHLGPATLVVASGGRTPEGQEKLHAYWLLTEAARGSDLARVAQLRSVVAPKVGADPSFRSLHQPIRVPGSIHGKDGRPTLVRIVARTGAEYELGDLEERVSAMPPVPGADVVSPSPARKPGGRATDLMLQPIRAGTVDGITRFDAVSKVIGHHIRMARLGRQTLAEAWKAVLDYNAAMISPPWPEDRLRRDFEALLRRDSEQRPGAVGGQDAPSHRPAPIRAFSEDWLADRFAADCAATLRHVPVWGSWFRWTGTHWQKDDIGAAQERVRAVCRIAAAGIESEGLARRIASQRTIRAVERIASSDPRLAMHVSEWDAHPMLLNTPAGIVDLETGEVMPHDPGLRLTQIASASPGKSCPGWLRFLAQITGGDSSLAAYLGRVCGYCLTESTKEQVFFFLHGSGANGKTVFLQTIAHVLGSYSSTAPLDSFMLSRSDRHSTDLAGLKGKRLITVAETEPGRSWAESRIKAVTGGDPISARFMHRDFFEFLPTFKLIVAGNHRPVLSGGRRGDAASAAPDPVPRDDPDRAARCRAAGAASFRSRRHFGLDARGPGGLARAGTAPAAFGPGCGCGLFLETRISSDSGSMSVAPQSRTAGPAPAISTSTGSGGPRSGVMLRGRSGHLVRLSGSAALCSSRAARCAAGAASSRASAVLKARRTRHEPASSAPHEVA